MTNWERKLQAKPRKAKPKHSYGMSEIAHVEKRMKELGLAKKPGFRQAKTNKFYDDHLTGDTNEHI